MDNEEFGFSNLLEQSPKTQFEKLDGSMEKVIYTELSISNFIFRPARDQKSSFF